VRSGGRIEIVKFRRILQVDRWVSEIGAFDAKWCPR